MKERPILFTAPMVRALLDGSKTQTRRAVKPMHLKFFDKSAADMLGSWAARPLPYGQPGDRLWVRETWCDLWGELKPMPERVIYRADGEADHGVIGRWTPAIHMFRWASRITLEITGVRVERLQDISEAGAIAEGIYDGDACRCAEPMDFVRSCGRCGGRLIDAIGLYRALWESINGPGSWSENPWVWVIEFKRVAT